MSAIFFSFFSLILLDAHEIADASSSQEFT